MLFSIIETIVIFAIAVAMAQAINGSSSILATEEDEDGNIRHPFNRDGVDSDDYVRSAILAVVVGAINYFAPKTTSLVLAVIFMVAIIILMVMVAMFAHGGLFDSDGAYEFGEYAPAVLALIPMTLTGMAASDVCRVLVGGTWGNIINVLPLVTAVGLAGYIAVDYCMAHYDLDEGDGYRYGAWISAIIAIVLIVVILLNACPFEGWASLAKGGSSEVATSLSDAEWQEEQEKGEEIQKILTLSDSEFQLVLERSGLKDATLLRSSMPSKRNERIFEDAISTPLESGSAENMKYSLMVELRNPIWLAARFQRLTEITYGNGTKVTDVYPSITQFLEVFEEKGVVGFINNEANEDGEFPLTEEYLRYAVIGELLFDTTAVNLKEDVTTKYVWRLDETGVYSDVSNMTLANIQPVKRSYVEDEEYNDVLAIIHRTKEEGGVLYVEYFDIYDRAPVILDTAEESTKAYEPEETTGSTKKQKGTGTTGTTKGDDTTKGTGTTGTTKSNDTTRHTVTIPDITIPDITITIPDITVTKPDESTTKWKKDKSKGITIEANDNTGDGPDSNNGVGARYGKKDNADGSNHITYDEYVEIINSIADATNDAVDAASRAAQNTADKQAGSDKDGNKVDDNSAGNGTGNGGADTATPTQQYAQTADGETICNDEEEFGPWGG